MLTELLALVLAIALAAGTVYCIRLYLEI